MRLVFIASPLTNSLAHCASLHSCCFDAHPPLVFLTGASRAERSTGSGHGSTKQARCTTRAPGTATHPRCAPPRDWARRNTAARTMQQPGKRWRIGLTTATVRQLRLLARRRWQPRQQQQQQWQHSRQLRVCHRCHDHSRPRRGRCAPPRRHALCPRLPLPTRPRLPGAATFFSTTMREAGSAPALRRRVLPM